MDNHRVAAWCWMQEISQDENFSIFHIDEHYDTLSSSMDSWLTHCESARTLSLQEYLELRWRSGPHRLPVFQWDNYLSIFLKIFEDQIQYCIFATQKVGDKPNWDSMLQPDAKQLLSNVASYLEMSGQWILNIDLDYFFCAFPDDKRELMFSKEYIRSLFKEFHNAWMQGKFSSVTLCLSPDEGYSGSWENAEQVLEIFTEVFDVPLTLG